MNMKKSFIKLLTMIIGLLLSALVYLSLWSVFRYFEVTS